MGGAQVHDFNPGITQNGLFWTTVVSGETMQVDLGAGTATVEIRDIHQKDYLTFDNAILANGPPPRPGVVSFKVTWTAAGSVNHFDNAAQRFRGDFREAAAKMEWSGRAGDYEFRSADIATSTTDFAELGSESNGSYY